MSMIFESLVIHQGYKEDQHLSLNVHLTCTSVQWSTEQTLESEVSLIHSHDPCFQNIFSILTQYSQIYRSCGSQSLKQHSMIPTLLVFTPLQSPLSHCTRSCVTNENHSKRNHISLLRLGYKRYSGSNPGVTFLFSWIMCLMKAVMI